jgi:hypothetical protein
MYHFFGSPTSLPFVQGSMSFDSKAHISKFLNKLNASHEEENDSDIESVAQSVVSEASRFSTNTAILKPSKAQKTFTTVTEAQELLAKVIKRCTSDNLRVKLRGHSHMLDGLTINMTIDSLLPHVTTELDNPLKTMLQWYSNTIHYQQKKRPPRNSAPNLDESKVRVMVKKYLPHELLADFHLSDTVIVNVRACGKSR